MGARPAVAVPFDPFAGSVRADPYPHYRALREQDPVHWCAAGAWLVTRDEDARRLLAGPEVSHWRRERPESDPFERSVARWLAAVSSGPDGFLRPAVVAALRHGARPEMDEATRRSAHRLLAPALGSARLEVVSGYARPLAFMLTVDLLGLPPEEARELAAALAPDPSGVLDGLDAGEDPLSAMLGAAVARRRARPDDGLLGAIARCVTDQDDAVAFARFFLFAAMDNVVNFIGNAVLAAAAAPSVLDDLRGPGCAAAIDELLRHDSPVQMLRVTARRDLDVSGRRVRAGEDILVGLAAANRDPAKHDDPDALDPRRPAGDHLAFGWGPGYCVGARLARRLAASALGVLAGAVAEIHPDLGALRWRDRPEVVRGPLYLPVSIVPRDAA